MEKLVQIHQENVEKIKDKRSTDSHAGAAQFLPDVSPDVVDGYRFQLLIALNLLVDGAFAGSQFPLV